MQSSTRGRRQTSASVFFNKIIFLEKKVYQFCKSFAVAANRNYELVCYMFLLLKLLYFMDNYFIDSTKMYIFKIIKNPAGIEIQILSFNFILTIKPNNISRPSPKEDKVKKKLKYSPINKPVAPKNCKIIANRPSFSKLNRLNSFFI
jgi:hypothetical protein